MLPDLVEYMEMSFHLGREKVELAVFFARGGDESVLFKGPDMMLCDPIVDVEGFREPVDVVGLFPDEVDDPSSVRATARPGENIP